MTAPGGFIELTSEFDGLAILVAVGEIAVVKEAGSSLGNVRTTITMRSGVIVPTATAFTDVVKRIATPGNQTKGT